MKKIILGLMAAMTIGATAMAQSQVADRSEMIQKRTESVAKKYGLSDEQKQKLLELNTKYADIMGPSMRMRGKRGNGGAMRQRPGSNFGARPENGDSAALGRFRLSEEQRARIDERRKQMKEQREAYNKELQAIMSDEQYKSYTADMEKLLQRRPRK